MYPCCKALIIESSRMAAQMQEMQHQEEMVDDGSGINSVEALAQYGINAGDIAKLRAAGVHTIESLAFAAKKDLNSIKGLSEQKVEKMQKEGDYIRDCFSSCLP